MYDLNFGVYFLYTWCTREWLNQLGRTPICRESRVNQMFPNTFPMRPKVYDLNFGMYFLYTRCTREWLNLLGCTPICRDSRVNHVFHNTFPMREY